MLTPSENAQAKSQIGAILDSLTQAPSPNPTATLTASATTIQAGQSVTLTWASQNGVSAMLNGAAISLGGSGPYSPTSDTTYTYTVIGQPGTPPATATVSVTVTPAGPQVGLVKYAGNPVLSGMPSGPDHDILYGSVMRMGASDWRFWGGVGDAAVNLNSAYYTSTDGITWQRPAMNQVSYNGNTNNNLLRRDGDYSLGTILGPDGVFYRMIDGGNLLSSPDGIVWSIRRFLQSYMDMGPAGGEAMFPMFQADGRMCGFFQVRTAGTLWREIARISANTTDISGPWSYDGVVLGNPDWSHQFYIMWISKVGNVWAGLVPIYYGDNPQKLYIDLYASTDEGHTWSLKKDHFIPNGPAGSWDSMVMFAGTFIQMPDTSWRVYYTGGSQPHDVYPRNCCLGFATISDAELRGLLA